MQPVRRSAHYLIRFYQLTLSSLMGRQCRFLPTCSEYTDDAIQKHGLWAGGWMGLSRICRCGPGSDSGYDPVPDGLPPAAHPLAPWRYGQWRGPIRCQEVTEVAEPERAVESKPVAFPGKVDTGFPPGNASNQESVAFPGKVDTGLPPGNASNKESRAGQRFNESLNGSRSGPEA